jgi:hypothetical protein
LSSLFIGERINALDEVRMLTFSLNESVEIISKEPNRTVAHFLITEDFASRVLDFPRNGGRSATSVKYS